MYTNFYEMQVHDDNGELITVQLRLPFGEQIAVKNRYKTDTRTVIFEAGSDDEKFADILDRSLNWKGNNNKIKSGTELIERMIDEGNMGMIARQKIMVEIGHASGIFSEKEMDAVFKRIDKMETVLLEGDGADEVADFEEYTEKKA